MVQALLKEAFKLSGDIAQIDIWRGWGTTRENRAGQNVILKDGVLASPIDTFASSEGVHGEQTDGLYIIGIRNYLIQNVHPDDAVLDERVEAQVAILRELCDGVDSPLAQSPPWLVRNCTQGEWGELKSLHLMTSIAPDSVHCGDGRFYPVDYPISISEHDSEPQFPVKCVVGFVDAKRGEFVDMRHDENLNDALNAGYTRYCSLDYEGWV